MTSRDGRNDAEEIRKIVEADEQKALARFRSSRFDERLNRRIADRVTATPVAGRLPSALRPVWVSLAVLLILGAAVVWLLRPRPQTIPGGTAVGAALRGQPGLEAIENPPLPLTRASLLHASPFEKDLASVLSAYQRTGVVPGSARSRGFSAIDPASEPLGLQRVYEILIIDRSVERVLTDISTKTKEG